MLKVTFTGIWNSLFSKNFINLIFFSNLLFIKQMCTLSSLAASGLNVGVLIYCRNSVDILFLRPSRFPSRTPLISRSASLSINSMISWVSLQSCSWKERDIINQYYIDYICSSLHLCIGTQLYWYKIEVKHCRNHAIHVIILFSECKCVHKITVKSLSCLKFDVHVLFAFHANTYLDSVFECEQNIQPFVLGEVLHVDAVVDVP